MTEKVVARRRLPLALLILLGIGILLLVGYGTWITIWAVGLRDDLDIERADNAALTLDLADVEAALQESEAALQERVDHLGVVEEACGAHLDQADGLLAQHQGLIRRVSEGGQDPQSERFRDEVDDVLAAGRAYIEARDACAAALNQG